MKDWSEQVITAALTIAIVAIFVVGVHRPRQAALAQLREQIAAQEQLLAQTQQRCTILMPLTRQVEQLRALAPILDERLPDDRQAGPFLAQLAEQLRRADLGHIEVRPASPVDTGRYRELPIRVGFSGSFGRVFGFLASLEALPRVQRISELSLKVEPGRSEAILADMVLSVYATKE